MDSSSYANSSGASKNPSTKENPGFFTWAWWKNLFSAMRVDKYGPKEWGIWNLSSYISYGMVYGVFKPVSAFITTKFPWLVPALQTAWAKFVAVVVAAFEVLTP